MAWLSQNAAKIVITLFAACCVTLFYLDPGPEARAEDRPDAFPGESPEILDFDWSGVRRRFLVTFMSSEKTDFSVPSSATVVSVTNLTSRVCDMSVAWFKGFAPENPVCVLDFAANAGETVDFCSRALPISVTACDPVCALVLDQGKAIVGSSCSRIGVSARVYYTAPEDDSDVLAITDSKIVGVGVGNKGD
jgi:hypothetical protein